MNERLLHLLPMTVRGTALLTSSCIDVIRYFRQGKSNRMSNLAGNGATGASGTGPALGYTLNQFCFIILFIFISENNMNTGTYFISTISLIYVMKFIITFGIKIY